MEKVILDAVNKAYQSIEEFEEELNQKCIKVVFLIDGLEEIFQHTVSSQNERNAIAALCRDFIDEVKISYHNLGFMIFFSSDTFQLTQGEEKIMKQEGYLRIDNDRYYLPEIIRHALKFKYGKGAHPKVLSLLLK